MTIHLIPFAKFGQLRMKQFWQSEVVAVSGITCMIGWGDGESVGWSYFLWPAERPGEVSEIRLESFPDEDCPADGANKVLSAIGLPLRAGDTENAVIEKLGSPVTSSRSGENCFLEFELGADDRYWLRFGIHVAQGLRDAIIVRRDRMRTD